MHDVDYRVDGLELNSELWTPWGESTMRKTYEGIRLLNYYSSIQLLASWCLDPTFQVCPSQSSWLLTLQESGVYGGSTHDRKQSYLYSGIHGQPWYQENTPIPWGEKWTWGHWLYMFFFCHEMCVKANESVQHNGVLQCGRPHPFLKVASGPLKRTSGDLKRKGWEWREGVPRLLRLK